MLRVLSIFILLTISTLLSAKEGYEIKVSVKNYADDKIIMGYYFGDKQYAKDTISKGSDNIFTIEDKKESLKAGMYFLISIDSKTMLVQFLVDNNDQHFSLEVDAKNSQDIRVKGSSQNQALLNYGTFLQSKMQENQAAQAVLSKPNVSEADKKAAEAKSTQLNEVVKAFQQKTVNDNKGTLLSSFIKSNIEIEMPTFDGKNDEEKQLKQYVYFKKHFFDNINLSDDRLLYTPTLHDKVQYFIDKLTVQIPDSINKSLDDFFVLTDGSKDLKDFYMAHFLNQFAASKLVGMDAVYVHLALDYYAKGKAPSWTEEENKNKIIENAKRLERILIGKTAPDVKMYRQDGSMVSLHEVKSPITVLFVWDPDCGHCKESMPEMMEFYKKYKDKGVEIFAICAKVHGVEKNEVPKCWEYIQNQKEMNWMNVIDPYLQSGYKTLYDIQTTPQIFVLDKKKKILLKRINSKQLMESMDKIIEDLKEKNAF